jgi:hypothetical protein
VSNSRRFRLRYRCQMVGVGLFLMVLAAGCALAYELTGSYVDAAGVLREPFALIPLGWLSGLAGASLFFLGLWRRGRGMARHADIRRR